MESNHERLHQLWANHCPGAICGPLSFLIWCSEHEAVIVSQSVINLTKFNKELNTTVVQGRFQVVVDGSKR